MKKGVIFILFVFVNLYIYAQTWDSLGSGMNYDVFAITTYNNDIYAGGEFITAGGNSANYIAKWNGSSWSALGTGLNYRVFSMVEYNGELYVGGSFTLAGGNPANHIAKWNGTTWFPIGTGINGDVRSLTVYNGELYAGGFFSTAGGNPASYIAKWNGTTWSPVGTGINGDVRSLIVYNGELYAGGFFATSGGSFAGGITKWNGIIWSSAGVVDGEVDALITHNGYLYAGGAFKTADGDSVNNVAKWDGTSWSALGAGLSNFGSLAYVYALASYNGLLFAGGYFAVSGGWVLGSLAQWDGISWSGAGIYSTVNALKVNNGLYAGGKFESVNGVIVNNIARLTTLSGIEENDVSNSNFISIYPNPFVFKTTISFNKEIKNATIKIVDLLGKEVKSYNFSGKEITIEKIELEEGIYFVNVISKNNIISTKKIIIQQ